MISINNLSFHFGGRTLYDEASLHIKPKDRIGLIGANGTGKSTLLRLLVGEYLPDGGSISRSGDCTIGFLNQDLLSYQSEESILHVAMQAFERALEVQEQIEKVLVEMENDYQDSLVDKLTHLQEEYERLDGYTLQARAEEILEGLGFSTDALQKPLRQFSGGWRMRVMLAKLLLQKPSLLLLDEPTNHLDLPSIEWIEQYLERYEGAVVIVSHDREFLDNTVETTVEVAGQKLNIYEGNYGFYLEEKALRNQIQKGAFENQQSKIRQTERFITRFKAKASKSKQVQSRVKMLERIDMVDDVADENAKVHFRFNFGQASGRQVCQLEHISKAYGPLEILKHTGGLIEKGDKIALIGANGRGKSTLLRLIAGTEAADNGDVQQGYNVRPSFFAQHQLESLNLNNSMLEELKQAGSAKTEVELRTILGCFLFSSDEVFKKIKVLSGGEKSRIALAKTLISEANFLLLDEPTNHLDMQSVNILIQALQQYEGTFITVSHDRFFVANVANKIWYIEEGRICVYPGTYDEYEYWQATRTPEAAEPPAPTAKAPEAKKNVAPVAPKAIAPDKLRQKAVNQAEEQVANLEKQIGEIEKQMQQPAVYNDPQQIKTLKKELQNLQTQLSLAIEQWEKVMV